MKILFYVEPLVEREDPLWKSPWLDFVKRFTYPLLSAGGDEHQCLAMVGEPLASTARDLLNDVAIVAIDPTSLLSRFGRSALDIASRWYRDKPGDVGVAQMAALVREAAGAFQPDVCISFSAAPFLRYAFPAAQVLYFEYGMFSRPPFPATAYLDPEGMYRSSYPMRHAAVLREREPQTDEVAVVDAVRTAFAPRLDQVGAPLLDAVRVARRSFRKAVLLPLQFSGYYAYDVNAAFTDQYDLLTQTLASVPEDCAVLVVEHPEHPVLKPATLQYLQQRHRNLVWLPESRGLYAAAQCLVPSVDAVVTVSSSVGWQTLLWRKPLLVVGSSHLDCIADSNDLSDLPRLLEPAPWPDWKERVLAWLLTHYFVPFDILFESPAAKLREVVSARAPVRLEAARVERLYVEAASRGDLLPALRGDQIHGLVGVETVVHLADRRVRSLERSLLRLGAEGGQLRVSLPSGAPVGRLQVRLADSPPVVAIRGLEIGQEGGPKEALSLGRIRPSGYSSQFALPGNVVLVGDTAPRSLLEFEVSLDGVTRPTLLVMELRRFSTSDLLYAAGVPRAARDESGEVQVEESKRSEQLTGNEARELTMPASIVGARNRALAESDERVEATYVLAADSRQRAETLYALLVERNTALEDARSRLAESATRAHQWATEALKRTDDLRAAEARLQQQQGIVGALQSALAASDAKRAHLLAESNEARAQVAELRHTIETTRAEAQRVADELNEEIVARGRWAVGLEKERDAERVRIEEQRGEISRLQVELASAAGQLHHARRDLAAVMNSTSWRLTAPLRALRRSTSRVARGAISSVRRVGVSAAKRAYHALPLSMHRKSRLKAGAFRVLEPLFRGSEEFRAWQRYQPTADAANARTDVLDHVRPVPDAPTSRPTEEIAFPAVEAPLVSVIIPVFNKLSFTLECLRSIRRSDPRVSYEVIVVDDCSGDETPAVLPAIANLRYLRNERNLGFVGTCNHGAREARGQLLLFLNNDTQVQQRWMDELVGTLQSSEHVGIVGSQLIWGDGRLQESGNLICQDGTSIPLGRGELPSHPDFSYLREVDFSSGASILLRRADFEAVGGFDMAYAPAYYEDPDLALKIRSLGKRNFVQPLSKVVHFENTSYGEQSYNELTTRNRQTYLKRWGEKLRHQLYASTDDFRRNPKFERPRVLFIDALVPVPDKGAGSVDAVYFMQFLIEAGYDVVFYGQHTPDFVPKYTPLIQRLGVQCLYRPHRPLEDYLQEFGHTFSLVLVARVYQAEHYAELIRRHCAHAAYVFNTVDVHFLRESRQAEVEGSDKLRQAAERTRTAELAVMAQADATIVISSAERDLLSAEYGVERLHHVPLIRPIDGRRNGFAQRRDLVFIGSAHLPNVDAVFFYAFEVLPLLRTLIPGVRLRVIGEELHNAIKLEPRYAELAAEPSIEFLGFVEHLGDVFEHVRLMVAPLRYGSGVKGKIASALGFGLPCVSTSMGAEGMGLIDGQEVLIGDTPSDIASQLARAYGDEALWYQLSEAGLRYMQRHFSLEAGRRNLLGVVDAALAHRNERVRPDLALARFGGLPSYQAARDAAVDELQRRAVVEAGLCARDDEQFTVRGYCRVCDRPSEFLVDYNYSFQTDGRGRRVPNWRERMVCSGCGLNNRMRAALHLFQDLLRPRKHSRIYLTEHVTPLAKWLRNRFTRVESSEYLGDRVPFGSYDPSGIRNESLTELRFGAESLDFILSFDVFEHIPDYLSAFRECLRCLAPGGALLFSVPFLADRDETLVRARVRDGEVVHLLEPEYHGNPVDPSGGALCFQVFGWQMLTELRELGFAEAEAVVYWSSEYAYLGGDQILFLARKPISIN